MEARAEQIDAMTPEQAGSELEKWYDSKKDRKNTARGTLFGGDVWDNLLATFYEKSEDPTACMFFIGEFWNEMLLARRRQGHVVRSVISEFISRHMATGDMDHARKQHKNKINIRTAELRKRKSNYKAGLKENSNRHHINSRRVFH